MAETFLIALGSSHPEGRVFLQRARKALGELSSLRVLGESQLIAGAGVGCEDPLVFVNQVLCVETALSPSALWFELSAIEAREGRIRTKQNAARTLDLDLLWWSGFDYHDVWITLPHPRFFERTFLLDLAKQSLVQAKKSEGLLAPRSTTLSREH